MKVDGGPGRNVRINAIAPGFIETAMSKTAMSGDPERFDRTMRQSPMGTLDKPDDLGWFLASIAVEN